MPIRFITQGITKYPIALIDMDIAHENVLDGGDECIFMLEHEALYSAGKSYEQSDFIKTPSDPIYYPKRGGRVTVHSPGQIVIYPIISLRRRNMNVHQFVEVLENWIIDTLKEFGICGDLSDEGIGVWVEGEKIGFVGVNINKGVSSHGICVNVSNDLSLFNSIVPCGIDNVKITSVEQLIHKKPNMTDVFDAFKMHCPF